MWTVRRLVALAILVGLVTYWLSPQRADAATQPTSGSTVGTAAFCTFFPGGVCPDWTMRSILIALGVPS